MKIAFFLSSIGDTDLALATIKSIEKKADHQVLVVALTKAAQQRVDLFQSPVLFEKKMLDELIDPALGQCSENRCTPEQLDCLIQFIHLKEIDQVYIGVPSSFHNELPFQIAKSLDKIPILMAYEFMFKPEEHCLWQYLPELRVKPNIQWALPLSDAAADFDMGEKTHMIGHLSIDNAYASTFDEEKTVQDIKQDLDIEPEQSLAFVSTTTQPAAVDASFLDCLLAELPHHPNICVRLGIHPGIQDLDAYFATILAVYQRHSGVSKQFQIILPENLLSRFKHPEQSINDPLFQTLFLRVNISGAQATRAADRVAQAVPGALLNQSVLEGKPAYTQSGKPYLPCLYFANSIATFFSAERQAPRLKLELGLDEKTAPERCAEVMSEQMRSDKKLKVNIR